MAEVVVVVEVVEVRTEAAAEVTVAYNRHMIIAKSVT